MGQQSKRASQSVMANRIDEGSAANLPITCIPTQPRPSYAGVCRGMERSIYTSHRAPMCPPRRAACAGAPRPSLAGDKTRRKCVDRSPATPKQCLLPLCLRPLLWPGSSQHCWVFHVSYDAHTRACLRSLRSGLSAGPLITHEARTCSWPQTCTGGQHRSAQAVDW
jgi:hypothetical protein